MSRLGSLGGLAAQNSLIARPIPSSAERIPVIGIGTRDFGGGSPVERSEIKEVLDRFAKLGGKVIDTASGYTGGTSETMIGEIAAELGNRDRLFLATKVNARGKAAGLAEIEQSFRRLRTNRIDLISVHNLTDTPTQLETLRELKQAGRIRYLGITTSSDDQYDEFEKLIRNETLDFIQFDYAIDDRAAGERFLAMAADRRMAVTINLPFGRRRLFATVQNQVLPDWAKEFDCKSWAQFFLKYIVAHPGVTCAIPGTRRVEHLLDNIQAAQGRLPDAAMRRRMEQFIDKL